MQRGVGMNFSGSRLLTFLALNLCCLSRGVGYCLEKMLSTVNFMTLLKIFRQKGNQPLCNFITVLQWFVLWTSIIACWCVFCSLLKQKVEMLWYGNQKSFILVFFWTFHSCRVASGRAASVQGGIVRLVKVPPLCRKIHKSNKSWGRVNFTSNSERRINPIMYKGNTGPIRLKRTR